MKTGDMSLHCIAYGSFRKIKPAAIVSDLEMQVSFQGASKDTGSASGLSYNRVIESLVVY